MALENRATGERNVVVFGGGGFIGRHLVRRLGKTGAVVRVPSRHVSRMGHLRTAGVVGQIVPEMVAAFDDAELQAVIQGADAVINLIGILAESRKNSFERDSCRPARPHRPHRGGGPV